MSDPSAFDVIVSDIRSAGYIVSVRKQSDGCYSAAAMDRSGRAWHVTGRTPLRDVAMLSRLLGLPDVAPVGAR